jgi:hypothetical protein
MPPVISRRRRIASDPILRRITSASDEDRQEVVDREAAAAERRALAEDARQWAGQRARERTPRPDESGRDDPRTNPEEIIGGATEGEQGSEEGRDIGERDIVDPDDLPGDVVTPDKHNSDPDAEPEIEEGADEPTPDPSIGAPGSYVTPTTGDDAIDDAQQGDLADEPDEVGTPGSFTTPTDEVDDDEVERGDTFATPESTTAVIGDDDGDDTDGVLGDDASFGDAEAVDTDASADGDVAGDDRLFDAGADPDFEGYPEGGTVAQILDWVDGDEDRASYALEQENERDAGPRKGVTEALEG